MDNISKHLSEQFKKLAQQLREQSEVVTKEKMRKSAMYMHGMVALKMILNKVR